MINSLKKIGLAALMVMGLVASTEAQSQVIVRQNGQTVIVVTMPRQERCEPRQRPERPRREHRRQSGRHFHVTPRTPGRYDPVIHVFRPERRCR